jgi:hypothetical protein
VEIKIECSVCGKEFKQRWAEKEVTSKKCIINIGVPSYCDHCHKFNAATDDLRDLIYNYGAYAVLEAAEKMVEK